MLPLWLSITLVLLKQTSIISYCNLLRVGGGGGGGGGRESPAGDISYRQALGGARGFMMVTWWERRGERVNLSARGSERRWKGFGWMAGRLGREKWETTGEGGIRGRESKGEGREEREGDEGGWRRREMCERRRRDRGGKIEEE
jgi:hypothetical protein